MKCNNCKKVFKIGARAKVIENDKILCCKCFAKTPKYTNNTYLNPSKPEPNKDWYCTGCGRKFVAKDFRKKKNGEYFRSCKVVCAKNKQKSKAKKEASKISKVYCLQHTQTKLKYIGSTNLTIQERHKNRVTKFQKWCEGKVDSNPKRKGRYNGDESHKLFVFVRDKNGGNFQGFKYTVLKDCEEKIEDRKLLGFEAYYQRLYNTVENGLNSMYALRSRAEYLKKNRKKIREQTRKKRAKFKKEKFFGCKVCNLGFPSNQGLAKHLQSRMHKARVDGVKFEFDCKPCNYGTDSRKLWKRHLKIAKHTNNILTNVKNIIDEIIVEIIEATTHIDSLI